MTTQEKIRSYLERNNHNSLPVYAFLEEVLRDLDHKDQEIQMLEDANNRQAKVIAKQGSLFSKLSRGKK